MACLPRFTWVDPHPCEPEQQMRCCRWWGGASGGVRVPIRLHRGPGRSRPFTSQSLTTRLMGGAGGNDSSGKPYPSTASHDSGLHSTNHLASSTATTTGGEDSCPMKGDESQPEKDGWFAHHQHRLCLGDVQGCENRQSPHLTALVPHRERVAGVPPEMEPRVRVAVRAPRFPPPSTGSASPGWFPWGLWGVNRHRLRLEDLRPSPPPDGNDFHSE